MSVARRKRPAAWRRPAPARPRAGHAHHVVVAHLEGPVALQPLEAREPPGREAVEVGGDLLDQPSALTSPPTTAVRYIRCSSGPLPSPTLDARRARSPPGGRAESPPCGRAGDLPPVHRHGAPHVAPRGHQDADRPAGGCSQATAQGLTARHAAESYPIGAAHADAAKLRADELSPARASQRVPLRRVTRLDRRPAKRYTGEKSSGDTATALQPHAGRNPRQKGAAGRKSGNGPTPATLQSRAG